MKYDFLIIGGGIAGSVLAYTMRSNGYKVRLYDYHNPSSASRVAAGLLNPITGRRFSLSWKALEAFPMLHKTYGEMATISGEKLIHEMDIVRLCNSLTEFNDWTAKSSDDRYINFIKEDQDLKLREELVDFKSGAVILKGGGYLDTRKTLSFIHHYLGNGFQQVTKLLSPDDIEIRDNEIRIGEDTANHLVLAEGYLSYQNPFFSYLPFTPMKGEILELVIPDFYEDRVFIRGGFLVPFGNSHYRLGATYDGENINEETTESAEANLVSRVEKYLKADYSVSGHLVGVRPAVKDRRPIIGTHPKMTNVHLFNGFGSKGSSLAPLLSKYFLESIENGSDLPEECDIRRFEELSQNS